MPYNQIGAMIISIWPKEVRQTPDWGRGLKQMRTHVLILSCQRSILLIRGGGLKWPNFAKILHKCPHTVEVPYRQVENYQIYNFKSCVDQLMTKLN